MFDKVRTALSGLFIAVAFLAAAAPAAAQDTRAFYKGKTIRFVVHVGPGGGFDAYARMLAPLIEKELDATVVVQNMPGAGGLIAYNHVYAAAGDGTVLHILNASGAALSQLLGEPNVRYDVAQYTVLGIIVASPWMWLASPRSPMQTLQDFTKPGAKVSWAGVGQIGGLSDGAAVTCEALKLTCRIVRGYEGSAQAALALARGETDAMYVSDGSANSYVKAGNAKPVVAVSTVRSSYFKDVPTVFEALPLSPEAKWWFEFRSAIDDVQRVLVMPPNVPKEQAALMEEVVRKILTDPAVIEEGRKTQRFIDYKDAAATRKMIGTVAGNLSPQERTKVKDVLMRE